jgi:hypothetical protein
VAEKAEVEKKVAEEAMRTKIHQKTTKKRVETKRKKVKNRLLSDLDDQS